MQGGLDPAGRQSLSTSVAATGRDRATVGFQVHADPLGSWLPRRRADLFAAGAAAVLAFLVFMNSLWNGFVYDDLTFIEENPAIGHLSDLRAILAAGYWPDRLDLLYRPLVIFSYALNYAVAGLNPFSYHLVNVLLHGGNSALVYHLFVMLFKARGLALGAAVAFALHPIHTEAVAYTLGRADLLASVFLLLSWWWYLKWDEAPVRAKTLWLTASVAAFGLALLSKEHAVILPGLLILTDLLRTPEGGLPRSRIMRVRCLTAYVWYLLPLAGYCVVRVLVLGGLISARVSWLANPLGQADTWTRSLTAIKILGKYLWLLLVPVRLSSDYSYNQIPVSSSLFEPAVLVALLALLAILALAVWNWRRRSVISMGVAIFAIAILPVSHLLFPMGTIMAERVLYLPSLGFCLLLAGTVTALAARPRWSLVAVGAFGLLLLGYGGRTVLRNWDWRSNLAIFTAAARTSPNSADAHAYLGDTLLEGRDLSGARREFERSLEMYPTYSKALIGIGLVLEKQGQIDEAIRVYQKIEKGKRYYGRARLNIGFLALKQGNRSEALTEFREVAQLGFLGPRESNELAEGFFQLGSLAEAQAMLETARHYAPDVFFIRRNLAGIYLRQKRWEDALRELEAAASLMPDSAEIQLDLGKLYAQLGFPAAAETALRSSLGLQPGDPDALSLLGGIFVQQGRLQEAKEVLLAAISLRPKDAEARYNLGVAFEGQGKLPEAREQIEAALRLRPQYPMAHRALGKVLERQGRSVEARREFQTADRQEKSLRSGAREGSSR